MQFTMAKEIPALLIASIEFPSNLSGMVASSASISRKANHLPSTHLFFDYDFFERRPGGYLAAVANWDVADVRKQVVRMAQMSDNVGASPRNNQSE